MRKTIFTLLFLCLVFVSLSSITVSARCSYDYSSYPARVYNCNDYDHSYGPGAFYGHGGYHDGAYSRVIDVTRTRGNGGYTQSSDWSYTTPGGQYGSSYRDSDSYHYDDTIDRTYVSEGVSSHYGFPYSYRNHYPNYYNNNYYSNYPVQTYGTPTYRPFFTSSYTGARIVLPTGVHSVRTGNSPYLDPYNDYRVTGSFRRAGLGPGASDVFVQY